MNKHMMRPTALAMAISLIAGSLPLGASAQSNPQQNRRQPAVRASTPVTLNFVNTDIEAVSRAMSAALGKPILVDPRVKGTMTLTAEQPVPVQEAYLSYLAALRGMGFSMVEAGGLLKLVPEAEAKLQTGAVTIAGESRQRGDQVVTQIFKLNHENANNLVAVLRPLITPNNTINANPGNNSLVITDYAENLQRISRIVAALDQPSNTDIEVIPLRNAVASDIVQLVQRLSEGGSGAPGAPVVQGASAGGGSVMADPRSNALIVRASNPAKLAQLRAMIAKLDQPGTDSGGAIRVIYLKNADAVRLATVLRAAYTNNAGPGAGGSGNNSGSGGTGSFASAQTGSSGSGNSFAGNSGSFGGSSSSSGSSSGSSSTGSSTQVSQTAQVNTGGFVQADPATNSLIITAPEPMYRQIRAVVEQLDTRRAQIYVEALIVKVDASKLGEFGVQFNQLFGNKGDSVISGLGTNFGTGFSNILNLSGAAAQGVSATTSTGIGAALSSGQIPTGLNLGFLKKVGNYYTLGAVANALGSISGTNVLSTPSLVVQDNEEADLLIGSNVPVLTGAQTSSSSSTSNPFQTFERRDVGLRLKVRTTVGESGTVRMKVYQENSSVVATATAATQGPTFDKSAVETSVTLEDGQVLVLGGMLKDEYTDGEDKVPGLGDIPLLGNLFKNQARKRVKSNLMIFLRPVVLRTPESAAALTTDRYDAIRAYQQEVQPKSNLVLPDTGAPMLPEKPASAPPVTSPSQLPLPVYPASSPVPGPAAPASAPQGR
ncbi:type II secretion system secretin GspD [Mitsuaria sp. GD03876]|uniref:type II secretion system secretin GspD n=1 Tax=Mitsuaria sp. GD03876 TaxID=2975399 RepID=UPI00244D0853|nr:type II secretion system secretin GspD [Mitsuaria sp. GD03876]MDH0864178.1 type II secretion system secretin GspD [Mitsuaria sp. GD03876]